MHSPEVITAFNTDRFEETFGFYSDLLGLAVKKSWDLPESRGALLHAGGNAVIEIFAAAKGAPALRPPAAGSLSILIEAEDLEARLEELKGSGARNLTGIMDRGWGWAFSLSDPNGIEIYYFRRKTA